MNVKTGSPKKSPRVRTAMFKVFKFLLTLAIILLIGGFALFIARISTTTPPEKLPDVDGIVVLTGADGSRLIVAAELLRGGHGERLLISGVNRDIKAAQIQTLLDLDDTKFTCCVDLDYDAENTYDNGRETANWVRALGYEKIVLVTSSYHMPRAKMEISSAMDGIDIVAYPVATEHDDDAPWWGGWDKTRLLAREYGKLLVSFAREPGRRPERQSIETPMETPVADDNTND